MKKRLLALITGAALVGTLLAGCGSTSENTESPDAAGNTGSASGPPARYPLLSLPAPGAVPICWPVFWPRN